MAVDPDQFSCNGSFPGPGFPFRITETSRLTAVVEKWLAARRPAPFSGTATLRWLMSVIAIGQYRPLKPDLVDQKLTMHSRAMVLLLQAERS